MKIIDIGPEAFANQDGPELNWRGVNYYSDAGTLRSVWRLNTARLHNARVRLINRRRHGHDTTA